MIMTQKSVHISNEKIMKRKSIIGSNWKIKLASIPVIFFILI